MYGPSFTRKERAALFTDLHPSYLRPYSDFPRPFWYSGDCFNGCKIFFIKLDLRRADIGIKIFNFCGSGNGIMFSACAQTPCQRELGQSAAFVFGKYAECICNCFVACICLTLKAGQPVPEIVLVFGGFPATEKSPADGAVRDKAYSNSRVRLVFHFPDHGGEHGILGLQGGKRVHRMGPAQGLAEASDIPMALIFPSSTSRDISPMVSSIGVSLSPGECSKDRCSRFPVCADFVTGFADVLRFSTDGSAIFSVSRTIPNLVAMTASSLRP